MKARWMPQKVISLFLAILMAAAAFPGTITPAYAVSVDDEFAPDGQTWEEAYPAGGFLFKESMKYTQEGDDAIVIDIYRMGGRGGRAVANIAVTPVAPQGDTVNAAGFNDFTVTSDAMMPDSYLHSLGEFGSGFMDIVFEDGDYIKSIEFRAVDDTLSEPEELVLLTIFDAQGAQIIDNGNRFTVCVQDNDPYVESEVRFAADSATYDKSAGTASIDVVRTGGIQYVFTVDYETVDNTAYAGTDYVTASGSLQFKGGEDRKTIEIPLIDDKVQSLDPGISFKVRLTNPKGGFITAGQDEARVFLYNTAAEDAPMNTATLVTDSEALDISAGTSVGDPIASVAGPVTLTPEERQSTPVKEASSPKKSEKGGIGPMSIVVPSDWELAPNQGGWKAYTHLAYDTVDLGFNDEDADSDGALDIYFDGGYDDWEPHTAPSYSTIKPGTGSIGIYMLDRSSSDNMPARVWNVFSASGEDPYGYIIMKSPDIDGMYEFYKGLKYNVSVTLNDYYVAGSKQNRGTVALTANDAVGAGLIDGDRGAIDHMLDNNSLAFIDYTGTGYSSNAGEVTFSQLKTALGSSYYNYDRFIMGLRDYCWEDNTVFDVSVKEMLFQRAAIANMQYEVVCKDGDSYLEANNILNAIKPTISFDNDAGGTDADGKFYIGSKLLLTVPASAGSFKIKKIELRKKNGSNWVAINTGSVASNKLSVTIQLRSSKPDKAGRISDLSYETADSAQYSLYVEMERTQQVIIDFSPSVLPQGANENNNTYLTRISAQFANIASQFKNATGINFTYNPIYEGEPGKLTVKTSSLKIYGSATDLSVLDPKFTKGEMLIYDNKANYGAISIKQEDFNSQNLTFIYYDADAMAREQQVRITSIESVTMYLDENDNGQVDVGTDTLMAFLDGGRETNSFFAPEKGKDDAYHQKLIKIDYVKVPKKIVLSVADDQNLRYDIKAYFMCTATGAEVLNKYTAEMKEMREINTGDTKVPVYGTEAAKGSITIPLGGDLNPPVFTYGPGSTTEGTWSWSPDFMGNLKYPYTNPEEITEKGTVIGDVTFRTNGVVNGKGEAISNKSQINAYLGSFRNTDQIVLHINDDKNNTAGVYNSVCTYRDPVLGSFAQNQDLNSKSPEGGDNDQVNDTPGAEKPEMSLPGMNIPAGPFEIVVEEDKVGFEVGIPIFGMSKGREDGKKKTEKSGLAGNASKYLDDMKEAVEKGGDDNIFNKLKDLASKTNKGLKPSADYEFSFEFAFNASFMWAYDKTEDRWEFDEARIFVTFNGEIKISQRLPPVPIIYVYLIFSADVEVGLNIDVDESNDAYGMVHNNVTYTGDVKIEIGVEAGIGVGVELCKFEIYLKVNIGVEFKIAEASEESGVDTFELGAALGFRAEFLCFSYEMDAISFKLDYEKGRTDGNMPDDPEWNFSWAAFGQDQQKRSGMMSAMGAMDTGGLNKPPRVRLSISERTYDGQYIRSGSDAQTDGRISLMSIPTAHGFELGEYNTGASATKLTDGLGYSSDYKLFTAGGNNYILYVIDGGSSRSTVDKDLLVLSEITGTGFVDPTGGGGSYTVVDRDGSGNTDQTGDLSFDICVDGSKIKVLWTDYINTTSESDIGTDLNTAMAGRAANTRLKYAEIDLDNAAAGFGTAQVVEADATVYHFLPKVTTDGTNNLTLAIKAVPYTQAELEIAEDEFKTNLINQLGVTDKNGNGSAEDEAKSIYPYFDLKVGNYRNMNTLYGKYSKFFFGVTTGAALTFTPTDITPDTGWQSDKTRVEQADLYSMSTNEFYMAYTTSYNYLDNTTNMTAKRLYLRRGTIDAAAGTVTLDTALLLRSLVDSDDDSKDGVYVNGALDENQKFIDPFFGGLEFHKGKLSPSGASENFLLFNMNNRYYVIDQENLNSLIGETHTGNITPFFELEQGAQGDNKGDFNLGVDGDGNISAVYTSTVPYTNNNAIFLTKYDPNTGTWGKGIMLAMRGMSTYEGLGDGVLTEEQAKAAYYQDDYKLIFQKPQVVISTSGALQLVAQTVMTELQEVEDPMSNTNPKARVKIPVTDSEGYALPGIKGFYAMSFPVGTRKVGFPSLTFTNNTFVPGSVLAPRITFKNAGDFALRSDETHPLKIRLMLGNGIENGTELATWNVTSNIPSGDTVDTLLNSPDTVYAQTGTQILSDVLPEELDGRYLYFTVNEDSSFPDAYSYNSLDDMLNTSGFWSKGGVELFSSPSARPLAYSTEQDKAELAIDSVSIKQGGGIVTVDGVRYMPLDIDVVVRNYSGKTAASDAVLAVYYRQTDAGGNVAYIPTTGIIGANGSVSLGSIAADSESGYHTNNSDYEVGSDGNYIIRTDGSLEPKTDNDLLIPLSWFDVNAADHSMELKFVVSTSTPEFDTTNNTAFAGIQPASTINAQDTVYVTPNEETSFPLTISSSSGGDPAPGDIELSELLMPGKPPLLAAKTYDSSTKTVTVEANDDGDSILRIADLRTASFKDIVIHAMSGIPTAPSVSNVAARNGSAVVYITPPSDTGGGSIIRYQVEAVNTSDNSDTKTQYATDVRHEFAGLTNGKSYRFRAAAVNSQATGPWSEWSEPVTPQSGDYPPLDAAYPVIGVQPLDQAVDVGGSFTLEVEASSPDGGSLSYQWYKNTSYSVLGGTAIENGTEASLTVTAGESGLMYYYCEITNTNNNAFDRKSIAVISDIATVSVGKGLPVITTAPSATSIWTGQKLSSSRLTGGAANVPGTFSWSNPDLIFAGDGDFPVIFTPDDTENYNSLTIMVHVSTASFSGADTDSSQTASEYKAKVKTSGGNEISLLVTVDEDTGTASIDADSLDLASGDIVITMPSIQGVSTYALGIPVTSLSASDEHGKLIFNTDTGSLAIPSDMLTGVSGSKAEITIGQGDKSGLPPDVKAVIGSRPLIQLTLSIDGKQTDWSNPNAPVTVSVPYTPTEEELAHPESIVIWYIDGAGNVVTIPNGHYDPVTGTVTFDTTHFSEYAVAYNKVSFNDVPADAWYHDAVSFIAAREITSGTGNGNYSPNSRLTRGEFIVMLMKTYGIEPDINPTDNFSDAGNTYYTNYLAAAKRLMISAGVGNNKYAPAREITRQEMFTLLYNALKVIGQLPQGNTGKTLSDFTDAGQIDSWAKDAITLLVETGIIEGSAGKLTPLNTTTRAEMAQVLHNLLEK